MESGSFENVRTECLPGVGLGEDRMAQGTSAESSLLGIANLKDQFHGSRIPGTDLGGNGRLRKKARESSQ